MLAGSVTEDLLHVVFTVAVVTTTTTSVATVAAALAVTITIAATAKVEPYLQASAASVPAVPTAW